MTINEDDLRILRDHFEGKRSMYADSCRRGAPSFEADLASRDAYAKVVEKLDALLAKADPCPVVVQCLNGATVEMREDGSVACTLPAPTDESWGRPSSATAPSLKLPDVLKAIDEDTP